MQKKFRAITATAKAQEKRLSRRFTVDVSEWQEENNTGHHYHDPEQLIRSEFDQLNRNLSASGKYFLLNIVNNLLISNNDTNVKYLSLMLFINRFILA